MAASIAGWPVLLPPVLAIALALSTRQIYLALFAGLWLGTTLLVGGNPIVGLERLGTELVAVFADPGNTRIVFFCLLVGGLIALVQASGGVLGFIQWMQRRGLGTSRRGAELLAWLTGMVVFVESSITSLAVGAVNRPLFDKLKLPREKLAYYCDATSAPVCMMIPLNGWGAYVLGLLAAQGVGADAIGLLLSALAFNLFAILAIVFALLLALTGWSFGPMAAAERRARETGQLIRAGSRPMISEEVALIAPAPDVVPRAVHFLGPLAVMMLMMLVSLWITGAGDLTAGSGSTAVLWSVSLAIGWSLVTTALPIGDGPVLGLRPGTDLVLKGMAGLLGPTILIVFAFALGQVSRALEMGPYVVGLFGSGFPAWCLPAMIFLAGCVVSFTLGSSWTTFAILVPLALPLAEGLGVPPALMLGAVLSGGIYGDHSSPLSDTSIISSMAAACDHVDHVNTQLPYTLLLAGAAFVGFLLLGWGLTP
ncbi:MAG: Na+/H+ antiporter NhaC family protein [Pseudomonadota bacterium]